jgi:hypothetical protein
VIHKESLFTSSIDKALLRDIKTYYQTHERASIGIADTASHKDITSLIEWRDDKAVHPEDMYYNLFKHFLRDPNRYPILERKEQEFLHELRDMFILDGEDAVIYALGDMEGGWPVGVFRLGINTLRGEVQQS